jgi:hypothetical protein
MAAVLNASVPVEATTGTPSPREVPRRGWALSIGSNRHTRPAPLSRAHVRTEVDATAIGHDRSRHPATRGHDESAYDPDWQPRVATRLR